MGPEVGAGGGQLIYFLGVADGEEEGVDAAVAPADDVGGVDVHGVEEGGEVVGHHLEV